MTGRLMVNNALFIMAKLTLNFDGSWAILRNHALGLTTKYGFYHGQTHRSAPTVSFE